MDPFLSKKILNHWASGARVHIARIAFRESAKSQSVFYGAYVKYLLKSHEYYKYYMDPFKQNIMTFVQLKARLEKVDSFKIQLSVKKKC